MKSTDSTRKSIVWELVLVAVWLAVAVLTVTNA
jgi:hypothetical protein